MWSVDPDSGVVEITGHDFAATKKFRDVARTHRAAIILDDVLPPFQPRGVDIRGHADAITDPGPSASTPNGSWLGRRPRQRRPPPHP